MRISVDSPNSMAEEAGPVISMKMVLSASSDFAHFVRGFGKCVNESGSIYQLCQ